MASNHPDHVLTSMDFIKKALKLIRKSQDPYLDANADGQLQNLNVVTSYLDFNTGKPGDTGDMFVEPFPRAKMEQLMDRNRPWENPDCPSILPIDNNLDNCGRARDLWNAFQGYLRLDKDDTAPSILDETGWKIVIPEEGDILFPLLGNPMSWKVEDFVDKCDPKVPHMSCFMTSKLTHRDMVPCMSELETILWITASRLLKKEYQNHRIVPVTIFSASGCSLRITQGYVNQRQLFVRMTPIIDFTEGEVKKWDEFIQTLCWMVGNPIGSTI
ncbi:hypothetical protein F5Y06DRAFT_272796 [Hypoxylon sp. FL0890]|nr:hypothetical protein F5Y06DRAFT_272796 [Hypoxylon sp. FL0890]